LTASQPEPGFTQAPRSDHPGVVPLGEPGEEEPQAAPRPPLELNPRKLAAAVLAGVAAVLVVIGTFMPYEQFTAELRNTIVLTGTTTSWQRVFENSTGNGGAMAVFTGFPGHPPLYGFPFAVAAAALLIGAALVIGRGTPAVAKATLVASAAATCAMAAMVYADASAYVSSEGNGLGVAAETGPALWFFLGGALVAVAAAAVAVFPRRKIPGADLPTPPMGFPMPYLEEQPETPRSGTPRPDGSQSESVQSDLPETPQVAVIPESPGPPAKSE
jgi:hypothetical protein